MKWRRWTVHITLLRVPLSRWWHAEYREYESAKLKRVYKRLQIGPLLFHADKRKVNP